MHNCTSSANHFGNSQRDKYLIRSKAIKWWNFEKFFNNKRRGRNRFISHWNESICLLSNEREFNSLYILSGTGIRLAENVGLINERVENYLFISHGFQFINSFQCCEKNINYSYTIASSMKQMIELISVDKLMETEKLRSELVVPLLTCLHSECFPRKHNSAYTQLQVFHAPQQLQEFSLTCLIETIFWDKKIPGMKINYSSEVISQAISYKEMSINTI